MKVLLVEDDRKAARLVSKGLHEAGFLVDVAYSAEDGDEMTAASDYAVIVLDWLLPGKDGVTFCRDLRTRGVSTPILMLTARQALDDRVMGLNVGADDYLTKPFAFAELVARLHALLRRSAITRPVVLMLADLALDPVSQVVTRAGAPSPRGRSRRSRRHRPSPCTSTKRRRERQARRSSGWTSSSRSSPPTVSRWRAVRRSGRPRCRSRSERETACAVSTSSTRRSRTSGTSRFA